MADRKYLCTKTFWNGVKLYRQGAVYLFAADPGDNFALTEYDPQEFDAARTHVDLDGTIYFAGNAANYDDFRFSLAQSKTGSNLKPDFDQNNNAYAFPQNDATEVLYLWNLTSHRMKVGQGVIWYPHLHFYQAGATLPTFEYRYRIHAVGAALPAFSDWIATTGEAVVEYDSGTIHQILLFPSFNAYDSGFTSVACMVDVQIRRNDNAVTGDVPAKEFDFHAPFDSPLGSGQEFIK